MTTATSTPPQPLGLTPSRRYREANASRCSRWATRMRRLKLVEPRFASSARLRLLHRRRPVLRLCQSRRRQLLSHRRRCSHPLRQHTVLRPAIHHFLDLDLFRLGRSRPRCDTIITMPLPLGLDLSSVKSMMISCDWQKQQRKMYARFLFAQLSTC